MSDDGSILSNLKNTITYKVRNAVTDPKANEAAKQEKEKEDEKKKLEEENKQKALEEKEGDPNKFSATRLVKKIGNQTLNIILQVLFPFIGLLLGMIVANEMIVYSAPIRIIFFVATFLVCYFVPFYAIILAIFYLFKGGYSYYINNMTEGPKRIIMPTIFALLPITTYKPQSSVASFFMYPFTYPKTELDAEQLPKIMESYWKDLTTSFPGYDSVKNLPIFVEDIKKLQKELDNLHKQPVVLNNSKTETNNTYKPTAPTAPVANNTNKQTAP